MNASYPVSEGPAASALSGADISWLAGFLVAGGLYCLVTPRQADTPARQPVSEAITE